MTAQNTAATLTAADALAVIAGHITIARAGLGGIARKPANDSAWNAALALLDEHMSTPNVERSFALISFLRAARSDVTETTASLRPENWPSADEDDEWDDDAQMEHVSLIARLEVMTAIVALATELHTRLAA